MSTNDIVSDFLEGMSIMVTYLLMFAGACFFAGVAVGRWLL